MKDNDAKLKNRQRGILQKLVQSYIKKGEPIASEFLAVRYHFDVSSATIRNDFQDLTEAGYLYKFHISGGRVPTDKAWKFFVQMILEEEDYLDEWRERWEKIMHRKRRLVSDWERLMNFLSEESQALSFYYLKDNGIVKKCGLKYLFMGLLRDFPSAVDSIPEIADALENLDSQVKELKIEQDPLIFIGRENPLINSDHFSVLVTQTRQDNNLLGIIGNKRMPYDRNLSLLKIIAEQI